MSASTRSGQPQPSEDPGPRGTAEDVRDEVRAEARTEVRDAVYGERNLTRPVRVPYSTRLAAAWSWRILVILAALTVIGWLVAYFQVIVIPVLVSALVAGLLMPLVDLLDRHRVPRVLASLIAEVGLIVVVGALLTLVGQQIASGIAGLWGKALAGYREVAEWLMTGPLHLSNVDLNGLLNQAQHQLQQNSSTIISGALSVGSTTGHVLAGFLLTLFTTLFLLLDGRGIWRWTVNLLPRPARAISHEAGVRGWHTLVAYVRTQILVALVDGLGIGIGAAILQVPLAFPLGVLVFLGSFIPIVGALITGAVAVLLALVAHGWVIALVMLGVVLLVQQAESHILQPFIMGKAVSVHPLAVVLAVAGGSLVAGIVGALFAVPIVAIAKTVVSYIVHADRARLRPVEPASPGVGGGVDG